MIKERIVEYQEYLKKRGNSDKTIERYTEKINQFFEYIQVNIPQCTSLDKVNQEMVKSYLYNYLPERKKFAEDTIKLCFEGLKSFFTFTYERGYSNDVFKGHRRFVSNSNHVKNVQIISDEDMHKIMEYLEKANADPKKQLLI